jgi:hypothetical protein
MCLPRRHLRGGRLLPASPRPAGHLLQQLPRRPRPPRPLVYRSLVYLYRLSLLQAPPRPVRPRAEWRRVAPALQARAPPRPVGCHKAHLPSPRIRLPAGAGRRPALRRPRLRARRKDPGGRRALRRSPPQPLPPPRQRLRAAPGHPARLLAPHRRHPPPRRRPVRLPLSGSRRPHHPDPRLARPPCLPRVAHPPRARPPPPASAAALPGQARRVPPRRLDRLSA